MSADLKWFKSSYSGQEGGNCVEVALSWSKSSHSGPEGGNCVEVATCPHTIHVRDSKDITVPALTVSPDAWDTFIRHAAA
ncbi:uncharacterized protein DUF397 [Streptomyces sp. KhCrAH-43]|uniref:DUF397 domain-containing protein n=1 Tax=unclassified Streptomyces TaxID=2593676 RepID=UPI00035C7628|nr:MULTISPECIES: DUF397 domain-containing protein [unclassified Streptomyces]MYS38772.1 DUF397 domain-containing protein [Streptomyces sp. SID4920]MYX66964.1 DUF397 domain-containing protein [Streptomyces sp. SID8373]RAJ68461.1 uncharacterized protein DUF397 [Streptomyces sp. KhCrAH-43]